MRSDNTNIDSCSRFTFQTNAVKQKNKTKQKKKICVNGLEYFQITINIYNNRLRRRGGRDTLAHRFRIQRSTKIWYRKDVR